MADDERSVPQRKVRAPAASDLEEGKRTHTYAVGDIAYWPPGPDVAIFYRRDDQQIPDPGIIVIGTIDSGVEALDVAGSVRVTVEIIK